MAGRAHLEPKDLSDASVLSATMSNALCPCVVGRPVLAGGWRELLGGCAPVMMLFIHSKSIEKSQICTSLYGGGFTVIKRAHLFSRTLG